MPVTSISICNLAISWLGGNRITSFDDESDEAKLCEANYDFSREAVLEDRNWTFAIARNMPPKLADPPAFGYSGAFQLPTDPKCIRVARISQHPDFMPLLDEWEKEGNLILANADVLYIKYIQSIEDPNQFSPGFIQALAARIAADICVPLTSNTELFANYWQLYLNKLETGGANDGLQGTNERIHANVLVRAR